MRSKLFKAGTSYPTAVFLAIGHRFKDAIPRSDDAAILPFETVSSAVPCDTPVKY